MRLWLAKVNFSVMKINFLPLLALLSASFSSATAQGLHQEFRQQQSEGERVLAICRKQYDNAEYWSSGEKDEIRFNVGDGKVQGILPEVIQQVSGRYACWRESYAKPLPLGANIGLREFCNPVQISRGQYIHPSYCLIDNNAKAWLSEEPCPSAPNGPICFLVEYIKYPDGLIKRKLLGYNSHFRNSIKADERTFRKEICEEPGLNTSNFCTP